MIFPLMQFLGALIFRMTGAVALFLSFVLSALYLSVEDFGSFQTYFVALLVINYLCLFGANEYIFKKTKVLSKKKLAQLIFDVFYTILPTALFFLFIFLLVIFLYDEQNFSYVSILFLSLPFNIVNLTLANAFKGNDYQFAFILSSGFIQNLSLMLLTLAVNNHLTLNFFSYIYFFSTFLTLLFSFTFLIKKYPISFKALRHCNFRFFTKDWRESINYYFLTMLSLFFISADLWVIKIFGNNSDLGLYAFAIKIASIVNIVHTSSSHFYISKLISLNQMNELEKFKKVFIRCINNNLIIITLFVAMLFGFLSDILNFYFKDYSEITYLMWILILAQFVNLITGPCGLVLSFTDKLPILIKSNFILLVIYIILLCILHNSFGIYGIAFSYLMYMIFWNIYLASLFKSVFNFYPMLLR